MDQYNDPEFVDIQMTYGNMDEIFDAFTARYYELAKLCLWRGDNCLKDELWKYIPTRNFNCLEFAPPNREIALPTEQLRFIFGKQFVHSNINSSVLNMYTTQVEKESLFCKIIQISARILQEGALSRTLCFQNLSRSCKINLLLQNMQSKVQN